MAYHSQDEFNFSEHDSNHIRIALHHENQPPFPMHSKQAIKPDSSYSPSKDAEAEAEASGDSKLKTKPIQKGKKKSDKIYEKRIKDKSIVVSMGRPDNCGPEALHLKENKSYNDIVYHFARFLIFLKLKQGEQRQPYALNLTSEQNRWMSKTEDIMAQDNYPAFEEEKPHFLLHPNSPHYVIDYLKKKEKKNAYSSEEAQFLMFSYLRRKNMLTATIYHYLCDYWKDIVFLVNNPKGDNLPNSIPEDFELDVKDVIEMNSDENNENVDSNGRSKSKGEKGKAVVSESALLKKELQMDGTIAAYEIACYLHACCEKHEIKIDS